MRILGLDIGVKNIGVALSDESATIAQGKETIKRISNEKAVERIKAIVEEYNVEEIIIGIPINMNGTKGERAEDSIRFAKKLTESIKKEVKLWDERLSTKEMEDVLIQASISRKKRKGIIDKLAAQIILQGYLDHKKVQTT